MPTPSTPAEAKQLLVQLFQLQAWQEQLQASFQMTQHDQCAWAHMFGRYADKLFNQHVIDQARIQELTAAHANKQRTGAGDFYRISSRIASTATASWSGERG
ncbi:hypothetical protein [Sporisorium scitamineum]|uniref:Uncharacterized protein n=1 Tax=Sporisorium scitamineum TaxID=49012 RepID=A0A0F7S8E2_9BASI|nr:hypothetical protein [Sporisorium scitamineum]